MLLWISLYYLVPALLCDRLIRLLAKRVTVNPRRKWLPTIGLTLSQAPLITTTNECIGPVIRGRPTHSKPCK